MRGISLLQKNKIEFSIIAVLTADSLDYPDEIFNFFLENQIRYIGFNIDEMEGVNSSSSFTMVNISNKGDFSTFSPELLSMKSDTYADFILGNLLEDTLESVSKTEKFKRIYQDIQAGVQLCQETCPYFSVCGGGAPANKYYENGSFRTAETLYCKYTKKIITDIVLEDMERQLELR